VGRIRAALALADDSRQWLWWRAQTSLGVCANCGREGAAAAALVAVNQSVRIERRSVSHHRCAVPASGTNVMAQSYHSRLGVRAKRNGGAASSDAHRSAGPGIGGSTVCRKAAFWIVRRAESSDCRFKRGGGMHREALRHRGQSAFVRAGAFSGGARQSRGFCSFTADWRCR